MGHRLGQTEIGLGRGHGAANLGLGQGTGSEEFGSRVHFPYNKNKSHDSRSSLLLDSPKYPANPTPARRSWEEARSNSMPTAGYRSASLEALRMIDSNIPQLRTILFRRMTKLEVYFILFFLAIIDFALQVEKQRIMQASIGKPVHTTDGHKGNQDLVGTETIRAGSVKVNHASASAVMTGNAKNMLNPITCTVSPTLDSSASASANPKLKCSGDTKKPSNRSLNFFDRFRKSNSKGSQNTDTVVQKATMERDSRPLLFKFNEGFTNAVKRPVRMHEFLL
ncbi:hypothetical protein Pint_25353 [Pistacia integerrima]|uniref:Uncharacterized protein n=1 Tax=Pistacia integerrima TaxID=434235 RepID=A0ACC0YCF6_9ROSI|nr:hypothetical protein Pint_25353 [Pistacia integerrima]